MQTIHELRKKGCKIRVLHWRYREGDRAALNKNRPELLMPRSDLKKKGMLKSAFPRGGKTKIQISFPDNTHADSETVCSVSDNFSYKKGVSICLGRLKEAIDGKFERNIKNKQAGRKPATKITEIRCGDVYSTKLGEVIVTLVDGDHGKHWAVLGASPFSIIYMQTLTDFKTVIEWLNSNNAVYDKRIDFNSLKVG